MHINQPVRVGGIAIPAHACSDEREFAELWVDAAERSAKRMQHFARDGEAI